MGSRLILIVCFIFTAGCSGINVTPCISSPASGGMECSPPTGDSFNLPYDQTENYVCLSPSDARTLLEMAKRCKK